MGDGWGVGVSWDRGSVWEDEVLETNGGDGCTTVEMCLNATELDIDNG